MFQATIAGVIAGLYHNDAVAALIVGEVAGSPRKGARFTAAGREFTLVDGFDHRPEAPDFPLPEGRIMTLIVTPDAELFDLVAQLRGQRISIGQDG